MRVLVTGSAGFIGSHIAEALAGLGHQVRGLDPRSPAHSPEGGEGGPGGNTSPVDGRGEAARRAADLPFHVTGDVRDARAVAASLAGVDAVCHQAARVGLGVNVRDLPDYASVNALGTAVLLAEMARAGVTRLVLASSMVVYGEGRYECGRHGEMSPPPRSPRALERGLFEPLCTACGKPLAPATIGESAALDPRNVYADTKVAQEHLAASWARATGGQVIALRYHNVYGPRMPLDTPYAGVAAIFRSRLERRRPPLVFEDGQQRRDFIHVRDVARANVHALEALAAAEPGQVGTGGRGPDRTGRHEPGSLRAYNIASGEPHTVGEMAAALAAAYGGPEPEVTGAFRLGDVRHIVAAPDRAADELGFKAEVSFAAGMSEFANTATQR